MAKKSASLIAAQQEFFAKNNISQHKIPVNVQQKEEKPHWLDDYDLNKIGLLGGDFADYIKHIGNPYELRKRLENARKK